MTINEDLQAGTKLWLSAWLNTGENGDQYLSIRAQFPLEGQTGQAGAPRRQAAPPPRQAPRNGGFGAPQPARAPALPPDDEIPF